jgi:hypothetical protein
MIQLIIDNLHSSLTAIIYLYTGTRYPFHGSRFEHSASIVIVTATIVDYSIGHC